MRPNHLHCYVTNRVPNIRILHESDKRLADKKIKIQLLDAKVVQKCLLEVLGILGKQIFAGRAPP